MAKPTTQGRLTVTSALKVLKRSQSCDTCWVVTVGHWPPAKVSFKHRLPDVACSVESSILAAGSLASGISRLDQLLRSPGPSKSYKICSVRSSTVAIVAE